MKALLKIFSKSFKSQLIYRSTMLFSIISTLLSFSIQISLWSALIGSGIKNGTSLDDMILYVLFNTLILSLTNANIASLIEAYVIDGTIAMQLLRPISYKKYLFFTILGKNSYRLITNVLPLIIVGYLIIGGFSSISLPYLLLFVVSVIIGMLIMFELSYVVGLLAFWIQRCWFLRWYLNAGTTFFGGTVIPLWFYPEILNKISWFLPFRYITFEPINFLLEKTALSDSIFVIAMGLVWLGILNLIGHFMWKLAIKKMTINGG